MKLFGWDLERPEMLAKVNTAGADTFKPSIGKKEREERYRGWQRAVKRAMHWNTEADVYADGDSNAK